MKKYLIFAILFISILSTGCTKTTKVNHSTNSVLSRYTRTCVDNKQFILTAYGLTIDLDFDGKPIRCGE